MRFALIEEFVLGVRGYVGVYGEETLYCEGVIGPGVDQPCDAELCVMYCASPWDGAGEADGVAKSDRDRTG